MPDDYESLYRQGLAQRIDRLEQRIDRLDNLVRETLDRFNQHNTDLTKELNQLRVELGVVKTTLKMQAIMYGAIASIAFEILKLLIPSNFLHP